MIGIPIAISRIKCKLNRLTNIIKERWYLDELFQDVYTLSPE
jgi:hypothetical protein